MLVFFLVRGAGASTGSFGEQGSFENLRRSNSIGRLLRRTGLLVSVRSNSLPSSEDDAYELRLSALMVSSSLNPAFRRSLPISALDIHSPSGPLISAAYIGIGWRFEDGHLGAGVFPLG